MSLLEITLVKKWGLIEKKEWYEKLFEKKQQSSTKPSVEKKRPRGSQRKIKPKHDKNFYIEKLKQSSPANKCAIKYKKANIPPNYSIA